MLLGALLAGPLPNGNICDLVAWPPTSYECCRENRFRIQSNSIPQRETNGKFYWGDGHFVTIKLQAFFSPSSPFAAPSKAKRTACGLPFLRDLFLTCVNYSNRQTFVFWTLVRRSSIWLLLLDHVTFRLQYEHTTKAESIRCHLLIITRFECFQTPRQCSNTRAVPDFLMH